MLGCTDTGGLVSLILGMLTDSVARREVDQFHHLLLADSDKLLLVTELILMKTVKVCLMLMGP